MSRGLRAVRGAALLCTGLYSGGIAAQAQQQEICVTCQGPDVTYRCKIVGAPPTGMTDPRAHLLCITELAKAGVHRSCSVRKDASGPCPGIERSVFLPNEPAPPVPAGAKAQTQGEGPAPTGQSGPQPGAEAAKSKPPQTVEELAKETARSSKEGIKQAGESIKKLPETAGDKIKKAGSAVGNAATKTWNCVTSLFSAC